MQVWFQNRRAKWRKREHTKKGPGRPAHNAHPQTCSGEPIPPEELQRREEQRLVKKRRKQEERLRRLEERRAGQRETSSGAATLSDACSGDCCCESSKDDVDLELSRDRSSVDERPLDLEVERSLDDDGDRGGSTLGDDAASHEDSVEAGKRSGGSSMIELSLGGSSVDERPLEESLRRAEERRTASVVGGFTSDACSGDCCCESSAKNDVDVDLVDEHPLDFEVERPLEDDDARCSSLLDDVAAADHDDENKACMTRPDDHRGSSFTIWNIVAVELSRGGNNVDERPLDDDNNARGGSVLDDETVDDTEDEDEACMRARDHRGSSRIRLFRADNVDRRPLDFDVERPLDDDDARGGSVLDVEAVCDHDYENEACSDENEARESTKSDVDVELSRTCNGDERCLDDDDDAVRVSPVLDDEAADQEFENEARADENEACTTRPGEQRGSSFTIWNILQRATTRSSRRERRGGSYKAAEPCRYDEELGGPWHDARQLLMQAAVITQPLGFQVERLATPPCAAAT